MGEQRRVRKRDLLKLRQFCDGDDNFIDRPNVEVTRLGRVQLPEGMNLDTAREFLFNKFPFADKFNPKCFCYPCQEKSRKFRAKCRCRECRQTTLLMRWWIVIRDCFIERKTASQVEAEQGWKRSTVGYTVQQIKRAWTGARLDGKQRTGRQRGRPKKDRAVIEDMQIAA